MLLVRVSDTRIQFATRLFAFADTDAAATMGRGVCAIVEMQARAAHLRLDGRLPLLEQSLAFLHFAHPRRVAFNLLLENGFLDTAALLVVLDAADAIQTVHVEPATEAHADAVPNKRRFDVHLKRRKRMKSVSKNEKKERLNETQTQRCLSVHCSSLAVCPRLAAVAAHSRLMVLVRCATRTQPESIAVCRSSQDRRQWQWQWLETLRSPLANFTPFVQRHSTIASYRRAAKNCSIHFRSEFNDYLLIAVHSPVANLGSKKKKGAVSGNSGVGKARKPSEGSK